MSFDQCLTKYCLGGDTFITLSDLNGEPDINIQRFKKVPDPYSKGRFSTLPCDTGISLTPKQFKMLSNITKHILDNPDNLFAKKVETELKGAEKDTKCIFTADDMKVSSVYRNFDADSTRSTQVNFKGDVHARSEPSSPEVSQFYLPSYTPSFSKL